ncbi:Gfo/Idh/MocA family oxidoreductase [Gammaproteobacteria bacterium]|nr:Gfo/Idh/MocA family oxidoreductase [Gammaproteobacteria bacterium]
MINCGIIGFGKMGRIRADAVENSTIGNISAIYDVNTSDDCLYQYKASPSEIIESPDIDAVFICTPNVYIPGLCIEALNAGKHVFSEKPPGFNATQVLEVINAERKAGNQRLMYGFNHRHHQSVQHMSSIVQNKELGRVLWMRGRYGKEVDQSFFDTWRAKPELAGAGILLDQGIHMVDLLMHFSGGFNEVSSFVSNLYWEIDGIEDNVFAIFKNSKNGICASVHSTMTQWRYLFSLEIFMERGALILNGLKTSSGAYGEEVLSIKRNTSHLQDGRFETEEQIVYKIDHSWQSEVDHFFHCIEQDQKIQHGNSSEALAVMQIVDKIYAVGNQGGATI